MRTASLARDLALAIAGLVILLAIPYVFPSAGLRDFLIYVFAFGLLGMSLNLLIGLTGLVSFGHAAYFAMGAYTFGILMQRGLGSLPLAFLIAVGSTALLALVIGAICVRLKEIYFAFITLAFQMMIHAIILTWVPLTGGDQGLMGGIPRPPFLGVDLNRPYPFYATCAVLFALAIFALRQISESPFGYTLRMIRDNPERALFLGVNVFRAKLVSFVLAGTMASVGGVILALFASGAYPEFAFWTTSGEGIFMIMLGGSQVFLGPLLGAGILLALEHYVTIYAEHYGLVLGIVILVAVLGLRRGLADFVLEWWQGRQARKAPAEGAADTSRSMREAGG